MVVLRFVHIVSGALWVGSVFLLTVVVAPGMRALGLPLDPLMQVLERRKFPQLMAALAGLTILAGFTMLYRISSGFQPAFMSSRFGSALSLGGVLALGAFVVGITVQRPAGEKAQALRAEIAAHPASGNDPRVAEMARLQNRIVNAGKVVALLLVLAVSLMAVARYL